MIPALDLPRKANLHGVCPPNFRLGKRATFPMRPRRIVGPSSIDIMARPMPTEHALPLASPLPTNAARDLALWADRFRFRLFVGVASLYLATFNGTWRMGSDQALYAGLGRNVANGLGYTFNFEHHTWVEPLTPLLVAAALKLGGGFPLAMAFIFLSAAVALALVFALVRLYADRPTAVVVTLLLAVCETSFRYAFILFTDQPFLATLALLLLGYELVRTDKPVGRWRWVGWALVPAGVFLVFATRPVAWTVVAALLGASAWHVAFGPGWRLRSRHAVVALLAVGAVLAFRAVDPRRSTLGQAAVAEATVATNATERRGMLVHRMLTEFIPMTFEKTIVKSIVGIELVPGVDSVVAITVVALGLGLARRRPFWGLLVAGTVAQCLLFLPRDRYMLPVLPLLLLAIWQALETWPTRTLSPVAARRFVGVVLFVLVGANVVLFVRMIVEQHRVPVFAPYHLDEVEAVEYPKVVAAMKSEMSADGSDVAVAKFDRVLYFLSDRKTFYLPSMGRVDPLPRMVAEADRKVMANKRLFGVFHAEPRAVGMEPEVQAFANRNGLTIGPPLNEGALQLRRLYRAGEMPTTRATLAIP